MSCSCSFYRQTGLGIEALINVSGISKPADLQKLFLHILYKSPSFNKNFALKLQKAFSQNFMTAIQQNCCPMKFWHH